MYTLFSIKIDIKDKKRRPRINSGNIFDIYRYLLALYTSGGKAAYQILFNKHKQDYNRNNSKE